MSSVVGNEQPQASPEMLKLAPDYFPKLAAVCGVELKWYKLSKVRGTASTDMRSQKTSKFMDAYETATKLMERVRPLVEDVEHRKNVDEFNHAIKQVKDLVDIDRSATRDENKKEVIAATESLEKLNKRLSSQVDRVLPSKDAKKCYDTLRGLEKRWITKDKATELWREFRKVSAENKPNFKHLLETATKELKAAEASRKSFDKEVSAVRSLLKEPTQKLKALLTKIQKMLDKSPPHLAPPVKSGFLIRLETIESNVDAMHEFDDGTTKCESLKIEINKAIEVTSDEIEKFTKQCEACENAIEQLEDDGAFELIRRRRTEYHLLQRGIDAGYPDATTEIKKLTDTLIQDAKEAAAAKKEWATKLREFENDVKGTPRVADKRTVSEVVIKTNDYARGVKRLADLRSKWEAEQKLINTDDELRKLVAAYNKKANEAHDHAAKLSKQFAVSYRTLVDRPDAGITTTMLDALDGVFLLVPRDGEELRDSYRNATQILDGFCKQAASLVGADKAEVIKRELMLEGYGETIARLTAGYGLLQAFQESHKTIDRIGKDLPAIQKAVDGLADDWYKGQENQKEAMLQSAKEGKDKRWSMIGDFCTDVAASIPTARAELVKRFRDRRGELRGTLDTHAPHSTQLLVVLENSRKPDDVRNAADQLRKLYRDVDHILEAGKQRSRDASKSKNLIKSVVKIADTDVVRKNMGSEHERIMEQVARLRQMVKDGVSLPVIAKAAARLEAQAKQCKAQASALWETKADLWKSMSNCKDLLEKIAKRAKSLNASDHDFSKWEQEIANARHTHDNNRSNLNAIKKSLLDSKTLEETLRKYKEAKDDDQELKTMLEGARKTAKDKKDEHSKWETVYKQSKVEWEQAKSAVSTAKGDVKGVEALEERYLKPARELGDARNYSDSNLQLGLLRRFSAQFQEYPSGNKFEKDLPKLKQSVIDHCVKLQEEVAQLSKTIVSDLQPLLTSDEQEETQKGGNYKDIADKLTNQGPKLAEEKSRKSLIDATDRLIKLLQSKKLESKTRLDAKEKCLQEMRKLQGLLQDPVLLEVIRNPFVPVRTPRLLLQSIDKLETQLLTV